MSADCWYMLILLIVNLSITLSAKTPYVLAQGVSTKIQKESLVMMFLVVTVPSGSVLTGCQVFLVPKATDLGEFFHPLLAPVPLYSRDLY